MICLPFPLDIVVSWKASLAIVFLDLWQTCSNPHKMLFLLITAFIDLYLSALSACIICWLTDGEGQIHGRFFLHFCYKKLLTSVEVVLSFYWSQLHWLGSYPKLKLWLERPSAQQCFNQKCIGLEGCPHLKPNLA